MAKRPKLRIDQIQKIRPFFQSACRADSKHAKKFEICWFFKVFLQRKPIRSHATFQKNFFKKVALMCMFLHLSFKNIVQFVLKVVIWALKAKKWPCPSLPFRFLKTMKKLGKNLSFSSSLGTLEDSRQFGSY